MNTYFVATDDEWTAILRIEAATPQAAVEEAIEQIGVDPDDLQYITFTVQEPKVKVYEFVIDISPRVVERKQSKGDSK